MGLFDAINHPSWWTIKRLDQPERSDAFAIVLSYLGTLSFVMKELVDPSMLGMRMISARLRKELAPTPKGGIENAQKLLVAETALAAVACGTPRRKSYTVLQRLDFRLARQYLAALFLCRVKSLDSDDKRDLLTDTDYSEDLAQTQLRLSLAWARILGQEDPSQLLDLMDKVDFTAKWTQFAAACLEGTLQGAGTIPPEQQEDYVEKVCKTMLSRQAEGVIKIMCEGLRDGK